MACFKFPDLIAHKERKAPLAACTSAKGAFSAGVPEKRHRRLDRKSSTTWLDRLHVDSPKRQILQSPLPASLFEVAVTIFSKLKETSFCFH